MPDWERQRTSILAIDPGGTTGWASCDNGHFELGQLHGDFETQAEMLSDLFFRLSPAAAICETYTITQRTAQLSQQPEALMLIGMVRWFASRAHIEIYMQRPSEAKGFATDAKLRALNWFYPSIGGHQNDAARHLMTWMARNNKFDRDTLIKLAEAA